MTESHITIRTVTDAESDGKAWDAYVQQHSGAMLAHQFAWKGFISRVQRLKACYWLAESAGKIAGIAPFFLRNHIGLGKRLTSVPYLNTGGILADNDSVRDSLWNYIQAWAAENGVDSIELRNRDTEMAIPGFAIREGRTVSVIALPETDDEAWRSMDKKARNQVRKAQKSGVTIEHGCNPERLKAFWMVYFHNMQLLGAPALSFYWFQEVMKTPELCPHMLVAVHEGRVIGGMIVLSFKNGAENIWAASQPEVRSLCPNDLMYREATRWAIEQGYQWLDLGRSETDSGHQHFKEKFAAQSTPLPYQEIQRKGQQWDAVTEEPEALYHAFTAVWSRLPLFITKRLGAYVSRQVY